MYRYRYIYKSNYHAQHSTAIYGMKMKEFDLRSSMIPPLFLLELSIMVFNIFVAQLRPKLYNLEASTILFKELKKKYK